MLSAAKSLCGNVILSEAKYLCVRSCVLFISFFLLRAKRKKRNQRKKKRRQNEIRNFSPETLKVALLHRVPTKKFRFRNLLDNFFLRMPLSVI